MSVVINMMEVIEDELLKNNANIDIPMLTSHINSILTQRKDMYYEAAGRLNSTDLLNVFYEMSINSVGRVIAYLALVYLMSMEKILGEDATREAVRLVVPVLKNIARTDGLAVLRNATRVEGSFIRRLCSSIGYTLMDIS